jgi:hypothetical protein
MNGPPEIPQGRENQPKPMGMLEHEHAHYLACGGRQSDPANMRLLHDLPQPALRVALVGNILNRNLQTGISRDICHAMF